MDQSARTLLSACKPACVCVCMVGASQREGKQSVHSVAVDVIRPVSSGDKSVCSGEELCSPIREELLYGTFTLD